MTVVPLVPGIVWLDVLTGLGVVITMIGWAKSGCPPACMRFCKTIPEEASCNTVGIKWVWPFPKLAITDGDTGVKNLIGVPWDADVVGWVDANESGSIAWVKVRFFCTSCSGREVVLEAEVVDVAKCWCDSNVGVKLIIFCTSSDSGIVVETELWGLDAARGKRVGFIGIDLWISVNGIGLVPCALKRFMDDLKGVAGDGVARSVAILVFLLANGSDESELLRFVSDFVECSEAWEVITDDEMEILERLDEEVTVMGERLVPKGTVRIRGANDAGITGRILELSIKLDTDRWDDIAVVDAFDTELGVVVPLKSFNWLENWLSHLLVSKCSLLALLSWEGRNAILEDNNVAGLKVLTWEVFIVDVTVVEGLPRLIWLPSIVRLGILLIITVGEDWISGFPESLSSSDFMFFVEKGAKVFSSDVLTWEGCNNSVACGWEPTKSEGFDKLVTGRVGFGSAGTEWDGILDFGVDAKWPEIIG